ncbi:hypothetical protein EDB92DRAFT_1901586 [Lactarius akahatsu]|uniref:Nucleoprotein TPR/MLP1 domain-containing protein n=1 Tax=Lactarius akahatsu TaxID=416441 RepID=A0AAD4Q876_9AGAM|nr:hypothetical protein EDB92DRAFT_1901586 [Lactarius akahatsu]
MSMRTRRKSKAAAAAAAELDAESVAPSEAGTAGQTRVEFSVPIPEDLDFDYLSRVLPDVSFDTPSPDSVLSLYRLVVTQAVGLENAHHDLEESRAENERKDVELDQALQDRESSVSSLETQVKGLQEELTKVKQDRDALASSKSNLESQISTMNSSQSVSSTELDSFKHRVEDTEREKRDLLSVVSRLKEDSAQRDEEIQTLRTSLKQARQDQQTLETQLRELRSAESSTKFKLDSLTQQLQLAKDEVDRTSKELAKKSEDFANYRHEKHASHSQLQSAHDALKEKYASAEGTLKALRDAHNVQSRQLTQSLTRQQDLSARIAEQDATYATEVAGLRRLIEMVEAREAQSKAIVENVEQEWEAVNERADRRESALREQVDRERLRTEAAEARIEELERVLEKVNHGEFPVPAPGTSAPSTPARGSTDVLMQGIMSLSPTVAIASRAQRTGKTFTEVYADHVRLQDEYAKKCAEYDRMDRTLAQVLAQIEERAPILAQQRAEYERLQSEAAQLASQLADALSERDSSASSATEVSQRLAKTIRENESLQKQLNDLGRQVQTLLKEIARRQDPTIPSDEELEADESTPADNIDEVITNHLVLFRSVPALQAQNQKLLGIVREMGAKMEAEEREYRETLEKEQGEAVREAHEAITALQEQLEAQRRAHDVKMRAFVKERDSLKVLLARAERTSSLKESHGKANGEAMDSDLAKELAEIQEQFDAYRAETGVDSVRLREDTVAAQREVAQLSTQLAKANAKLEITGDRFKMLQEQQSLTLRDLDDVSKRNRDLYERFTSVDIECNRVTEDLIAANGKMDQLRNECANLRAEKRIWESVESRLVEENKALSMERSHLSDLMANVQKMHNDIERSSENDRRRLESQIQLLEHQSQDSRQQLNEERQNVRRVTLQREVETKELRNTIDSQARDLQETRSSLVKAETTKTYLEQRVEELSRKLQGDAEKLAVYERRSLGVNGAGATHHVNVEGRSREDQLETEVADLRAALKVAEVDLAAARNHIQQFKEISQASEEALASLSTTHDEYKSTTESQLAASWAQQETLQNNLKNAEQELEQARTSLTESKRSFESAREEWLADKKTLEDTIVDFTASEKNLAEDRLTRESDVHAHEERVRAAEERYSREVIAHAEAIKAIEDLKRRIHDLQVSDRNNRTAAETAQAKLSTSEGSWGQQRQALDREIADLAARCKALTEQNNVLHQHLDNVSSQATRIRQAADSTIATSGEGDTADGTEAKLSELRAVINYLRKEKEIVDMQLELGKQENARLKTQIGHLTRDLEDTRATLSDERERAASVAATDAQHAELVEKIQQLNLLRESNATLRADSEAHAKRSRELDIKLKSVLQELDPLRDRARTVQAELDARNEHVTRLEEENRRWQERNSQLLSKYDRVDPTEFQSLKDQLENLRAEKSSLEAQQTTQTAQLQEKIAALEKTSKAHKEAIIKNNQIFRQRMGALGAENTQLKSTLEEAQKESAAIAEERDALKAAATTEPAPTSSEPLTEELERLRQEKAALEQALQEEKAKEPVQAPAPTPDTSELESRLATLTQERDQLLAEKEAWNKSSSEVTEAKAVKDDWESEKADLVKNRDEALSQAKVAREEAEKLKEAERGLRMSNEKLGARIRDQQMARQRATEEQDAAIKAAVDKATTELRSAPSAASEELSKQHAEELRALEERLVAKHREELEKAVEAATAKAQESAPAPAASPTAEEQKAAIDAAVAAALAAKDAEQRTKHQADIEKAVESGRLEGTMKLRLKDTALIRAQNKVKELESQIEEWKKAGVVPVESTPSASAPPATSPTTTAPSSVPSPTTSAPARGGAPLTRKTSVLGATASSTSAAAAGAGQPLRGRGRGAPRGGNIGIRGAAAPSTGRGAGVPASSTAGGAGGVAIMGAAAKRTREEGEVATEDSLAKRLKPAVAAAAASTSPAEGSNANASGGAGGKPITLQRNRVQPP